MDQKPVVIFDGRCRFCVGQAARLERLVPGRVELESFRDPGVIAKYPGLTEPRCEEAIQLVEPDGRIRSGAEAIVRTLWLRPMLRPLLALYYVPGIRGLSEWGYRVVARNRFRLRGEVCAEDACHPHGR